MNRLKPISKSVIAIFFLLLQGVSVFVFAADLTLTKVEDGSYRPVKSADENADARVKPQQSLAPVDSFTHATLSKPSEGNGVPASGGYNSVSTVTLPLVGRDGRNSITTNSESSQLPRAPQLPASSPVLATNLKSQDAAPLSEEAQIAETMKAWGGEITEIDGVNDSRLGAGENVAARVSVSGGTHGQGNLIQQGLNLIAQYATSLWGQFRNAVRNIVIDTSTQFEGYVYPGDSSKTIHLGLSSFSGGLFSVVSVLIHESFHFIGRAIDSALGLRGLGGALNELHTDFRTAATLGVIAKNSPIGWRAMLGDQFGDFHFDRENKNLIYTETQVAGEVVRTYYNFGGVSIGTLNDRRNWRVTPYGTYLDLIAVVSKSITFSGVVKSYRADGSLSKVTRYQNLGAGAMADNTNPMLFTEHYDSSGRNVSYRIDYSYSSSGVIEKYSGMSRPYLTVERYPGSNYIKKIEYLDGRTLESAWGDSTHYTNTTRDARGNILSVESHLMIWRQDGKHEDQTLKVVDASGESVYAWETSTKYSIVIKDEQGNVSTTWYEIAAGVSIKRKALLDDGKGLHFWYQWDSPTRYTISKYLNKEFIELKQYGVPPGQSEPVLLYIETMEGRLRRITPVYIPETRLDQEKPRHSNRQTSRGRQGGHVEQAAA